MTGGTLAPGSATSSAGPGTELNQTYMIDSLIGVGGMGEVFRGHNIQTGDPVAIKIVLPEYAKDEMILGLFRKEARVLFHLAHDAIVRYHVFSIDRVLGRPYLAMEYADGPSLAERIKKAPLNIEDVIFLQHRLADGLQKAHEAGIIHRDMSPDNVILPGGRVERAKIIDFGIARSANVGGATLLGGSFAGKYNFVSPEQLGLFGGEVTARSDVYGLGLVLAAALRGRPLDMSGTQVEVIEKRRKVPDLSDIDPRLRDLLEAMLQPDPALRLPSMSAVRDWKGEPQGAKAAAATIVHSPSQNAKPGKPDVKVPAGIPKNTRPSQPPKARRLNGAVFALLGLAVIAAGAFGGWSYVQYVLYPPRQEAAKNPESPPGEQTTKPKAPPTAPPPTEAPVPPQTEPQTPTEVVSNAAKIIGFVEQYDGGDCFYVAPGGAIGDNNASIVAYATSQEPAARFEKDFMSKFGFEPDIRLGLVSDQQCPVIRALTKLTPDPAHRTQLRLSTDRLASGRSLEGSISGIDGRNVELLVIDDEGNVLSLRKFIKGTGPDKTFRVRLDDAKQKLNPKQPEDFLPMLVLAVASAQPIASLASLEPVQASELLPGLVQDMEKAGSAATTTAYFKLVSPPS
jgi:serine/threonine protein kinase